MRKFWIYVLLIFQVGLIVSLVKGIQVSWGSQKRVTVLAERKQALEEEKAKLVKEYEYVQSQEYLDKVARNELQLSKEGETIVIVPEEARIVDSNEQAVIREEKSNWEKWWEVLFGE